MEVPFAGRAVVRDIAGGVEIVIPAKKNWFVILFLSFWITGWTFGLVMATISFIRDEDAPLVVLLIWTIFWAVIAVAIGRVLAWQLFGRDVIQFETNHVTLEKKAALFSKLKTYDLNQVKNIRIPDQPAVNFYQPHGFNFLGLSDPGLIRFDYGLQTIHMASGIDEAEAKSLVSRLKEKGILTAPHF